MFGFVGIAILVYAKRNWPSNTVVVSQETLDAYEDRLLRERYSHRFDPERRFMRDASFQGWRLATADEIGRGLALYFGDTEEQRVRGMRPSTERRTP